MKLYALLILLILATASANDQTYLHINMDETCQQYFSDYKDVPSICNNQQAQIQELTITDPKKNIWKIKLYFGFTRSRYLPTNMKVKTENLDITIQDFEFSERTSSDFL
jgi:DUF4097 and DUF4098 domain-containing protein YvlB